MGKWKTARRWGVWVLLTGFILAAVAAGAGWIWERSEHNAFLEGGFDPPGQMVRAGDHELHVVADGEGSPGVLLISGGGDDYRTWDKVQPRLADVTRVVSYDRPGLGWSPAREGTLSVDAAIEDIENLLANPDLFEGPPVLIGHSLGGLLARRFAYRHPAQISGLVLLDATPDKMPGLMKAILGTMYRLSSWRATVGLRRRRYYGEHPRLTREQALVQGHLNASGLRARETRREIVGYANSEEFVPPQGGLGPLPLTVFATTSFAPPGLSRMIGEVDDAKRAMALESERGQLIEMATGHYIHRQDPDAVIAAVVEMLSAVASEAAASAVGEERG